MKKFYLIPLLLLLGACQTTQPDLIETKYKVLIPDTKLFNCPLVKKPSADGLDDIKVGKFINSLYYNNRVCHNNMKAIEKFLDDAKTTIEK
jgi:hypothetical protein